MKINKQNIISKKAQASYLQILILIISTFAFAYLIYSATEVSAQTGLEDYACCEKTKSGEYCQFVKSENCDSAFDKVLYTECKNVDYCKLGCCFSRETGLCSENTPERSCRENNGTWKEDAACNIPQCQRGCCVLGRNALFTTQRSCDVEAGFLGITTDFRQDIRTEIECIFLTEKDEEGACVFENEGEFTKTCKFTTRESCRRMNGDFYKNVFCSDSALETDCKAHERKGCLEGEESVYWFDSCGNRENVSEECSIFTGTICGQVRGEYKCKSIDCDVDGKIRKNGESWCEYDGTIGEGKDVVGSRHWKHICFMGEERIEPCEDYRNQICVQSDTDLGNGKKFSEAACRINNWRSCLEYNTEEEAKDKTELAKKCNENPDCFVKHVAAADKFSFDLCVPKYPPGFDLTNEGGGENAEMVCSMASQKCTVIYVKKISGWKCEVNCDCEKAGFSQKMNELCTSLGDCGAYVNIAGEVTNDGYSIKGSPRLSQTYLNSLKQYAIPKPGQKPAEPGNLSFLGSSGSSGGGSSGGNRLSAAMGVYGVGFALQVASMYFGPYGHSISSATSAVIKSGTGAMGTAPTAWMNSFGNALAAAGSAMMGAEILSMAFDIDYTTALLISVAGVVILVLTYGLEILSKIFWPLLIVYAILKLLGIGKTKKKVVTFTCLPWQPPSGGKNCDKCNGDSMKPCSSYRCNSLGQTCELINQGTEQELCVDNSPNDVSSPRISPLLGIITENYQYYNIKDNGFEVSDLDGNCIPEFTNILYGIKTDKPSQCKISDDPLQTYDEMEDFFGGSNLYLKNHTTLLNIPSPEAFKNQYNLTAIEIKKIGEINFYVKCKSVNGATNAASYSIKTCVKPGPDLTPPYITKTEPANGAYIKYNSTEQALSLWTNEPADCKWDINNEKFDKMGNTMECQQDMEDYGLWGWTCNTTLTGLDENTKFYIRCQDISDNKNIMGTPEVYELKKSESNLEIEAIKPTNGEEIIAGTEPMTLTLEAETSGGAEDGKADCSFRFGETGSYIRFRNTFSNSHSQVFSSIIRGTYKIYVRCEDVAGNAAESSTEFEVKIDTSAPRIARVYYDGDLRIATDENSVCAYSFIDSRCRFDIENSTQAELMPGEEKEHSGEWQTENTYYIKCKDEYGREPGKCSIIVRPYEVI